MNLEGQQAVVDIPEPKLGFKLAFLVGGAVFAVVSYLAGTVLYEMELSLAENGILTWVRIADALPNIFRKHLLTLIPWVIGTTALSIALGYLFDKQAQYRRAAERLAATDSLTMLATRRILMEGMAREVARAERGLLHLFAVLMVDVDDFKKYNDSHGHLAGDKALQMVSSIVRETSRGTDIAGRFGGEEILLLLAGTDSQQALATAGRLRAKIEAQTDVTVSIGVASYPANGLDVSEMIRAADDAMYRAKRAGKNRVCLAETKQGAGVESS